MVILGIDPGYERVGYAVINYTANKFRPITIGTVTTPAHTEFSGRLNSIYEDLVSIIDTFKPEEFAIEELFYFKNQKTVIDVAQARGVILLAAKRAGLPIYEYTPLQVKNSIVGYGRAEKSQIQEMTRKLLRIDKVIRPDEAADAAAIAITHAYTVNSRKIGAMAANNI